MTQTRIDFPVLSRGARGLLPPGVTITVNAAGILRLVFSNQAASGTSTVQRGSTASLQEIA